MGRCIYCDQEATNIVLNEWVCDNCLDEISEEFEDTSEPRDW